MTILSWRAGLATAVLAFAGYATAQPASPPQQDPARQMWHDKIAGTQVVKMPRELVLQDS